jgi:AraC-like DNA-binding protein
MDRRIRDVLSLLESEWRRNHRLEDLATAVNLRPSRLEHLFKAIVKRSIREVIHTRRLEEAAKLIATTYERISEIVYFVGFRDVSNFNHAFRSRFGMSPREYRASMQQSTGSSAAPTNLLQNSPNQDD